MIDAGDDPVSWLLMPYLNLDPSFRAPLTGSEVVRVTRELAALMTNAHLAGENAPADTHEITVGLQHLHNAIAFHLGTVLTSLERGGYRMPGPWRTLTASLCRSSVPTVLFHGDLAVGNVIRDANDQRLRLLDVCGYLGPREFDAARWAARVGQSHDAESVLAEWLDVEPDLDAELAHRLLGLELLMEAGVREIIKEEKSLPAVFPDVHTLALLDTAERLLPQGTWP